MASKNKTSNKKTKGFFKSNKRLKIFSIVFFVLIFAGIGTYQIIKSFAAVTPQGVTTSWAVPIPSGGTNLLQHDLTIEVADSSAKYFWAHQFSYMKVDGGYIGLQSNGSSVSGVRGKTAVFSVFGTGINGYPSTSCLTQQAGFDGYDKAGTSCRIPYNWVIGHRYRINVKHVGTNATRATNIWRGYIVDVNTGVTTTIGNIEVPQSWQYINTNTVMWTEYFGTKPETCVELPVSRVRFYKPRTPLGLATGGPINRLSSGSTCSNSQYEVSGDSVIQQVGGYTMTPAPSKNSTTTSQPSTSKNSTTTQPQPTK